MNSVLSKFALQKPCCFFGIYAILPCTVLFYLVYFIFWPMWMCSKHCYNRRVRSLFFFPQVPHPCVVRIHSSLKCLASKSLPHFERKIYCWHSMFYLGSINQYQSMTTDISQSIDIDNWWTTDKEDLCDLLSSWTYMYFQW